MTTILSAQAFPGWETAAVSAIAALWGTLIYWMKRTDTRSQTQITKLEKKVDSQGEAILAAHNEATSAKIAAASANSEAKLAKLAAQLPCQLPECPKRSSTSFSIGEATEKVI